MNDSIKKLLLELKANNPACLDVYSKIETIHTKNDLSEFLTYLISTEPTTWDNSDLTNFLEAMAAFLIDMNGYYQNLDMETPATPTWKDFAQIIFAATSYE